MYEKGFLEKFKKVVKRSGLHVIPRKENREALVELNLTKKIRKDIIMELTTANYIAGPEADRDRSGEIWIFKEDTGGVEIYIKLKLIEKDCGSFAKCISFHKAQFPMKK